MVCEAFSTSDVTVILKTLSKEHADNRVLAGPGWLVSTSFLGFTVDVLPNVNREIACQLLTI